MAMKKISFKWGAKTYLMGILNLTPDSFSGDGLAGPGGISIDRVLDQATRFVKNGADILDVGGESTRPGAEPVGQENEIQRVLPSISALRVKFPGVPIAIDTSKAVVARAALEAGAALVNDVWGLRADPEMADLVADLDLPIVLMHNRSDPKDAKVRARLGGRYIGVKYENLIEDVKNELMDCVRIAHAAGIPDRNIILDPGIGFGKTVSQNLELLDRLDEIKALGYPILLGPSRKSFIGYTLDLPPQERIEGTAATVVIGIDRGADIVRVHDVEAISRVVKMTDAIVRRR